MDQRVINKYILPECGSMTLRGYFSQVVDIQLRNDEITAWIETSPYSYKDGNITPKADREMTSITFTSIGTGWAYDREGIGEYFKTIQKGENVWHVFIKWN